jgi:amidase
VFVRAHLVYVPQRGPGRKEISIWTLARETSYLATMISELTSLDATAQAKLVRDGEVTPLELVDAAIERIERLDPLLNAVILPSFERARASARSAQLPDGPFRGVPFLLKDLGAHRAGDPVHLGMRFLRDIGWTAPHSTYFADKIEAAGFVILGRTNTPELGLLPTTEPESYGPTRNPWDPRRSPGGSSGGSAAAVASGMVAAAHASDGGGSIRIPASLCGLVGLKPTRGRCSFGPDIAERWVGFSSEHVVSRSVRDTAAILDVVSGYVPGDVYTAPPPQRPFAAELATAPRQLRIGLMVEAPTGVAVAPDCVAAAEHAARLLESLGHAVERSHPDAITDPRMLQAIVTIIACSTTRALELWSEKTGRTIGAGDVEPLTWALAEMGRAVPVANYIREVEVTHSQARRLARWWEDGFDLLLSPTAAEPPPLLGEFAPTETDPLAGFRRAAPFGTFTSTFNATGQPAMSLPLYWNGAGLPIGVQLVAPFGGENLLIRIAAQLESAAPWGERKPRVHA